MRYAGEKRFNGWTALTLVLLALFLLFVIYPIGMLLIKSLFTGGKIDLSYFVKFSRKSITGARSSTALRSRSCPRS